MKIIRIFGMMILVFIGVTGLALAQSGEQSTKKAAAEKTKSYKCSCQSPCSGSVTCTTGCYAYCEENPEGSGRYVCVKGCASSALTGKAKLNPNKKYASVNISMPEGKVIPVLEKLYGKKLSISKTAALNATSSKQVNINLKNANMDAVMQEINK